MYYAPIKRHRLAEQMKTCACMHFHLSHHSAWPLKLYVIILWSEIAQSCPTLCDPVDCSLPGSSVHRIFQARVLEWVAFPSPGDLPNSGIEPWSLALQADALTSEPPGKPIYYIYVYIIYIYVSTLVSEKAFNKYLLSQWKMCGPKNKLSRLYQSKLGCREQNTLQLVIHLKRIIENIKGAILKTTPQS